MTATVRTWTTDPLDDDVRTALDRLAEADDVAAIAVMPDVHLAHGVCIGTVTATHRRIYPAAVGGDIGCGVAALRLGLAAAVQVDGEWLVELMQDGKVLARFPIYVGLTPPEHTLLVPTHPPEDEQDADNLATASLADVRDAYGLPPFERDPLLDAMSRTVLATPKVSTVIMMMVMLATSR